MQSKRQKTMLTTYNIPYVAKEKLTVGAIEGVVGGDVVPSLRRIRGDGDANDAAVVLAAVLRPVVRVVLGSPVADSPVEVVVRSLAR